jgi:branched-chain amino acid transport system permease protein
MQHLRSYGFVLPVLLLAAFGPSVFEMFGLMQISSFAAMGLAVLGLAFVWGFLGVLSLGHAAFFGLGAYAYAIAVINLGESSYAVAAAIAVPALFSVLLGYFLFFGRVSDVYLGVITLCVTLVLYNFTSATADPAYHIGDALLGGFNGITAVPPLNVPGDAEAMLEVETMFRLCLILLALVYAGLVALRRSSLGRIMVAIRESELRSELLGYDVRLYKMLGFTVSAAVAGLAGALFTAVNGYVGPSAFDLNQASQFLLWVIAGGLGSLAGPVIASFVFQYLSACLGTTGVNTDLVFGAIIMAFVLLKLRERLPAFWGRALRFRKPAPRVSAFTPSAVVREIGE